MDNIYYIILFLGEALERIRTTFIIDKGIHCEIETHENIYVNQLHMTNFKKKVTPTIERNRYTGSVESYNRIYIAIKASYNSKIDYNN